MAERIAQPAHPDRAVGWRGHAARTPGWLRDEEAELLHEFAFGASARGRIVEIGSFLGRSTICLASALELAPRTMHETLIAIDPHVHPPSCHPDFASAPGRSLEQDAKNPRAVFEANLERAGLRNRVEVVQDYSIGGVRTVNDTVSLAFIDGDHAYETARHDLCAMGDRIRNDGWLLAHDYTDWEGVTRAVDELVGSGDWRIDRIVGSIAVLRRAGS